MPPVDRTTRRLLRHPGIWTGGALVVGSALLALFGPWLAPIDPSLQDVVHGLGDMGQPLGHAPGHVLGTDALGRDVLSRLLVGVRISLEVGTAATAIALVIGVLVGLVSGYFRGWVDTLLMRTTDVVTSFPFLLLCLALVGIRGERGIGNVFFVLGVLGWTSMARVVRGKAMAEREKEYVEAARAMGFSPLRILFGQVLPNVLGPVVVLATLGMASAVLAESTLSYLGMGVPPPTPSLGSMIAEGQAWYRLDPRLILLPGGMVLLMVLGFNLLGEALRDVYDPRS
jgi:peptide/nickel transport system permease protein